MAVMYHYIGNDNKDYYAKAFISSAAIYNDKGKMIYYSTDPSAVYEVTNKRKMEGTLDEVNVDFKKGRLPWKTTY